MPQLAAGGTLRSYGVLVCSLLALALRARPACADDFLRASVEATSSGFRTCLGATLATALGCGPVAGPVRAAEVARELLPMWRSLPKNGHGRAQWRTVRYLAHRYFMRTSAILIRGFEPTRQLSRHSTGLPDILNRQVPPRLSALLTSNHAAEYGFSLDEVAHLIVVLEHLIFDSQSSLLDRVYAEHNKSTTGTLSRKELAVLLQEYMVHWMMAEDTAGIQALLADPSLREATFPDWGTTLSLVEGQIRALGFSEGHTSKAFSGAFSLEDAHEVVGSITTSFASFWEPQCALMKNALFEMDPYHTGRVPLSVFYSATLESEWHFTESEAYLRELGALDETSLWLGPQVIIPNYIQAAPNCIITTQHYWVCCQNECEGLFGEIEAAVGAPLAPPGAILQVVRNVTAQEGLDDDTAPSLDGMLAEQLEKIARAHSGQVPLHGRLFAQWLHYVFPHQCPFPHKTGRAAAISPLEFGKGSVASHEEMVRLASGGSASGIEALNVGRWPTDIPTNLMFSAATHGINASTVRQELQWMSQWSSEEELVADYSTELRAPWDSDGCIIIGGVALVALGLLRAGLEKGRQLEADAVQFWSNNMQSV